MMNDGSLQVQELHIGAVKQLLREIAEAAGDAIVCANTDGDISFMNHGAREVFGYSNEEIIGLPLTSLMPKNAIEDHTAGFKAWVENKTLAASNKRRTVQGIRKDGSEVTVQMTLNDLRFGGYHYVVALIRDVSEQEATRKSLRLLQAAFEAAAHSTVIANAEGRIVWVNPAFTTMTGYSADEAIGQMTSLLKSGEQDSKYYADLWQTILSGKTWNGTLINRRKDGTVYLEKQAITPVVGESMSVEYFVAVKEDVTAAVQTQQNLRKTHDRYRRLFESSPLALYEEDYSVAKAYIDDLRSSGVTDLRAYCNDHPEALRSCASMIKIIDVNDAACEMVGATDKAELLGNLEKLFTENSFDDLREQLLWLAEGNLSYKAEVQNKTLNGDVLVVELSLNIATEFAESWSEVILNLTDVTDRKRHERQLAHSMKMEAVGRLTSGIAHDFNNVLTIISGNLRLVSDMSAHEMGDETKEMLGDALSAADDGAQLTTRLLAFSRQPTAKYEQVDIGDMILDFAELMKRSLGSRIDIVTHIAENMVLVETDKSSLGDVLLNLSLNSKDAMSEGGVLTFEVRNGFIEEDAALDDHEPVEPVPCVMIGVIDTGVGMEAAVLEHATEPFFTTKPINEGNGLGLSMVQEFVNECGGRLGIASEPGVGTTMTLFLPITRQNSDRESPARVN